MNLYHNNVKIHAKRCKEPQFCTRGGKVWKTITASIDEAPVELKFETEWGNYFYFKYDKNSHWYKFTRCSSPLRDDEEYDIDPFKPCTLTTQKK